MPFTIRCHATFEAAHHLQLLPGTNVAVVNAISHVIATEDLIDRAFVAERCDPTAQRTAAARRCAAAAQRSAALPAALSA